MKNRRKKLAAMVLTLAMTGMVSAGVFQTPGLLTVMASSTESEGVETTSETEEPEVVITITAPENWQKEKATVKITAEDTKNTGSFSLAKMEAKISEDGEWMDITSSKTMEVSKNSSIYVKVTDQSGKVYTNNRYIESFDTTKPTLSAAAKDGVLIIRGEDEGSGVAAIYVNGNEFTELTDNTLNVRLQQADTTYEYFTLQVRDKAGNMSENYKVANPYYENPDTKKATEGSTNTTQADTTGSSESSSNTLPSDATASKPTSATGTVTEHTKSDSNSSGNADTTSDNTQTGAAASSTSGESGKEFYTITTKGDKVFYLIVDKDKTSDNVYLLTEVGENDLLNFTDSNTVTLPQNSAVTESALPDETLPEVEETETKEEKVEEPKEQKKSSNAGTYVMIVLVLLGVGGAYYYLKFIKGKQNSFEDDFDDEDEVEDEYETEIVDLEDSDEEDFGNEAELEETESDESETNEEDDEEDYI
ncbi:MAG: DUF4366 domain-containing protein [Lachnospiraceae bacterium]|nr:DUF4366 domain-containing protein [Lachnospiraceae bacterium]